MVMDRRPAVDATTYGLLVHWLSRARRSGSSLAGDAGTRLRIYRNMQGELLSWSLEGPAGTIDRGPLLEPQHSSRCLRSVGMLTDGSRIRQ
jgi:hypothetical protein